MFSWGSMYTLDENHHEGDLNVHRQGLDMIRSGAVKSSKNKDPNRSSIQRPFVMHHLCHIFASKRLPSKLYPPKTIQVPCFPNQSFTYPLVLEGWTPPKNVHQKIPPKKHRLIKCCWPHMHPHSRAACFKMPNNNLFSLHPTCSCSLFICPISKPNSKQLNQPNCKQLNQPNCEQPSQPNSKQPPTPTPTTNSQAPKAKGGVVEETPESGTLGTPQISELNRFRNRWIASLIFFHVNNPLDLLKNDPIHYTWLEIHEILNEIRRQAMISLLKSPELSNIYPTIALKWG